MENGHVRKLVFRRGGHVLAPAGPGSTYWQQKRRGVVRLRASLVGREQALPLSVLQNGVVAEVVLVRGLNAEGPLRSHAPHRLEDAEQADVLQLGQADVQGAERPCNTAAAGQRRPTATHGLYQPCIRQ